MKKSRLTVVRNAAAEYGDRVFRYPNVFGHGVGQRTKAGKKTGETCMVVFVRRKMPLAALAVSEVLPTIVQTGAGSLRLDVVEQAVPGLGVDSSQYRPVRGGCQISANGATGSGTLGAVMYDRRDADTVLLTCNHVLTRVGNRTVIPANAVVSQPGFGAPVGRTKRIVPWFLAPLGDTVNAQARVDAGIVTLDPGIDAQFRIIDLGKHPYVPLPPYEGLEVSKRGRTTELTNGTVEHVDLTIEITDSDGTTARIGGVGSGFSVRSPKDSTFFLRGDSGSMVVDVDGAGARGMMFAGDFSKGGLSYGCQLDAVMEELELETPCTGSLNAMFRAALQRRMLFTSYYNDVGTMLSAGSKRLTKFRLRYLKAAAVGTIGKKLEAMFQEFGPEIAEGYALDDDFAGLFDHAIGELLIQPSVFDMLEYRLPEDFPNRLQKAFGRLAELNPHAKGFEWVPAAFRGCSGVRFRDLLARKAPGRSARSGRGKSIRARRQAD